MPRYIVRQVGKSGFSVTLQGPDGSQVLDCLLYPDRHLAVAAIERIRLLCHNPDSIVRVAENGGFSFHLKAEKDRVAARGPDRTSFMERESDIAAFRSFAPTARVVDESGG